MILYIYFQFYNLLLLYMTQHHKSEDYKLSAVNYYLTEDKS